VRVEAGANGRPVRLSLVKPSQSSSVPVPVHSGLGVAEKKRSGLECEAKRRWSGISEGYDDELWLIGILFTSSSNSPFSEPNDLSEGSRRGYYPRRGM